ncbi:MAG: dipeptidase [Acidimicrobiaceae bacterium]|nr:dipeptidase [Acidimicrobiaceae bacterium]
MSNIVLGGGGNDIQASNVYQHFTAALPNNKHLLFLPQASAPRLRTFAQTWDRISNSAPFRDCHIRMWESLANRSYVDLDRFDGICLFGGNTYDLLGTLIETGFAHLLVQFSSDERPLLGISAGAIVLGRDVTTEGVASDPDKNLGGITDLTGLDLVGGYNVHCHYEPSEDEDLSEYSIRHNVPFFAIPETAGVAVTGSSARTLGPGEVHLFRNGVQEVLGSKASVTLGT